jgi:hypothetical protein
MYKHLKVLTVIIITGFFTLGTALLKDAHAGGFLNEPLILYAPHGPYTNFQVSGSYSDTAITNLVEKIGAVGDPYYDGIEYTIFGLFYGDENNTTIPTGWLQTVETNLDGSENYIFTVTGSGARIDFWNPASFGIYWGSSAPSGIGSMDTDSYLKVQVRDFNNNKFTGWAPAPDVITSDLYVIPEPVSSVLFVIGGATLGLRRLRKK